MNKKLFLYLLLIIILFLGGLLRFYHLKEKGFFLTDEAANSREAVFVESLFSHTFKSLFFKNITDQERATYISNHLEGLPLANPKPGHASLIALFGTFTAGVKDYTSSLMSAFFGLATIFLIYLLGKSLYSSQVGVLTAFLLSISGYHLLYSRQGIGEINTLFFFVLATTLYLQSIKDKYFSLWYLALSGLFIGIAYSCNYRWILMPMFFFLYELYFFYRKRPYFSTENLKRFLTLSIAMILPLAIYELFYHLVLIIFRRANVIFSFRTYFELLFDNFYRFGGSASFNIYDFISYPYYLYKLEGIIICLLLIYGVFKLIKSYQPLHFIILSPFLISLIFFGFYSADFPRFFVIALPSIFLIIAKSLEDLIKSSTSRKKKILILILILIGIFSVPKIRNILSLNSGLRESFKFLESLKDLKHITTHEQVSLFYVKDPKLVKDIRSIKNLANLKDLYGEGYHYLLVDTQKYITKFPHFPLESSPLLVKIESKIKPILVIKENRGLYFQYWFEHCVVSFSKTLAFFKNVDKKEVSEVRIYHLKDLFKKEKL
ncbi:glycosyltransferase family 39 protein [bacterium]|nr:glycosyltransferase family 39 protein [bacterium]